MRAIFFLILFSLVAHTDLVQAQQPRGRPGRPEARERMREERMRPVPEIGLRGIYDFDSRDFGAGAHVQLPLGPMLRLVPSAELYFGDETTWQLNADVAARFLMLRAGGGLALVDGSRIESRAEDDDSEIALNLFAGLEMPAWRRARLLRPFAEARWTFLDEDTFFRLVAGVNYPLRNPRR